MHDGRHKDQYRPEKGDVLVLAKEIDGEVIKVTRREVKQYVDSPVFMFYLEVYNYVKLWGMPNGRGWANEPCTTMEAITALEIESRAIEREEIESHGNSTGTTNPPSSLRSATGS